MRLIPLAMLPAVLLCACASNPPVTISYYHPRADLVLTVAETVGCDTAETPITAITVTSKMVYTADRSNPQRFAIKNLDGDFSNAEVSVTLSEDGRLTGLNASQAGQGSEILQAAIVIGTAVLGAANGSQDTAIHTACEYIKNNGDKGVITVALARPDPFALDPNTRAPLYVSSEVLGAVDGDKGKYSNIVPLAKTICYSSEPVDKTDQPPVTVDATGRKDYDLKLKQPRLVRLTLRRGADALTCDAKGAVLWQGDVFVPQYGTPYTLPLPRAPVFGKQSFSVALGESGAVTSLKYGKESGIAPALTTASKAWDAAQPKGTAEKAADAKAEADLIAQQERVVRCKADPRACT